MIGMSSASTTTRPTTDTIPEAKITPIEDLPVAKITPVSREDERAFLSQVDQTTGAPLNLRAAVAAVPKPADKLKILRRVDPNAKAMADGNFVYTPPGATAPILFDPNTVADVFTGDVVEALPFLGEVGGSIVGGIKGGLLGNVPGAIAGAGFGGGLVRTGVEQAMLGLTGTPDPRTGLEAGSDFVASTAASALGEGLGRVAAPVGKAVAGRVRQLGAAGVRQAADRLSIPLTAGLATGSRFLQNVENALASFPTTSGIMLSAFERSQEAAGQAAEGIVQKLAGGQAFGKPTFTQTLKDAAAGRIARYRAVREVMDNQIENLIGPQTLVPVTQAEAALQAMQGAVAQFPNVRGQNYAPAIRQLEAIVQDAQQAGGQVPFAVLREVRSNIGSLLDDTRAGKGDLLSASQGPIREAYAALTKNVQAAADMIDQQAIAAGLPSPGARQALDLHDAFVRLNRDPANPVGMQALKKMLEANPKSPMQWYTRLANKPKDIAAIRRAVTPQEWDVMAASALEDMGLAQSGNQNVVGDVWSPAKFLRSWNELGPQARAAMFGGTRYAGPAADIEALAKVAGAMKQGKQLANSSNTARALLVPLMISGLAGSAVGAARGEDVAGTMGYAGGFGLVASLSPMVAAKLLTSQPFLRTIRSAVTTGVERGANLIPRLVAIGRSDPKLREAVDEYIKTIGTNGYPIPDAQSVVNLNGQSGTAVQYTPR